MKICVVSPSYPTKAPNSYQFVENLCNAFALLGHNVTVVSPIGSLPFVGKKPIKTVAFKCDKGCVTVLTPYFISFGMRNSILKKIYLFNLRNSIKRIIAQENLRFDFVYSHFWRSGFNAFPYAKKSRTPLFVATGESNIYIEDDNKKVIENVSHYVSGVICVSSKNREESIKKQLTTNNKCLVLPNAIDEKLFYNKNKRELRQQYGFPLDDFIVVFVGYFIKRKGPGRVSQAVQTLSGVKTIYIGSPGKQDVEEPYGPDILYKGLVNHAELPDFLNCADIFVLPTLSEGCCNAIIEAMACGLPIVSSNRDFNLDVLDSSNSILVDPLDIAAIANAINRLKNDQQLYKQLSYGSLKKASSLTLTNRAQQILSFISSKMY